MAVAKPFVRTVSWLQLERRFAAPLSARWVASPDQTAKPLFSWLQMLRKENSCLTGISAASSIPLRPAPTTTTVKRRGEQSWPVRRFQMSVEPNCSLLESCSRSSYNCH